MGSPFRDEIWLLLVCLELGREKGIRKWEEGLVLEQKLRVVVGDGEIEEEETVFGVCFSDLLFFVPDWEVGGAELDESTTTVGYPVDAEDATARGCDIENGKKENE